MPDLPNQTPRVGLAICLSTYSTSDLRPQPQPLGTIKMVFENMVLEAGLSKPQLLHL